MKVLPSAYPSPPLGIPTINIFRGYSSFYIIHIDISMHILYIFKQKSRLMHISTAAVYFLKSTMYQGHLSMPRGISLILILHVLFFSLKWCTLNIIMY